MKKNKYIGYLNAFWLLVVFSFFYWFDTTHVRKSVVENDVGIIAKALKTFLRVNPEFNYVFPETNVRGIKLYFTSTKEQDDNALYKIIEERPTEFRSDPSDYLSEDTTDETGLNKLCSYYNDNEIEYFQDLMNKAFPKPYMVNSRNVDIFMVAGRANCVFRAKYAVFVGDEFKRYRQSLLDIEQKRREMEKSKHLDLCLKPIGFEGVVKGVESMYVKRISGGVVNKSNDVIKECDDD
jgi:hypothetical protein